MTTKKSSLLREVKQRGGDVANVCVKKLTHRSCDVAAAATSFVRGVVRSLFLSERHFASYELHIAVHRRARTHLSPTPPSGAAASAESPATRAVQYASACVPYRSDRFTRRAPLARWNTTFAVVYTNRKNSQKNPVRIQYNTLSTPFMYCHAPSENSLLY